MLFPSQFRGFHSKAQEYSSSGSYTFTPPAGVELFNIVLVGGGGGGGGVRSINYQYGGGGGGALSIVTCSIASYLTIIVGAGGAINTTISEGISGEDSYITDSSSNVILFSEGGEGGKERTASSVALGGGTPGIRTISELATDMGGGNGGDDNIEALPGISKGGGFYGGGGSLGVGSQANMVGNFTAGQPGVKGGGGGAPGVSSTYGGAGGDGYCLITWVS